MTLQQLSARQRDALDTRCAVIRAEVQEAGVALTQRALDHNWLARMNFLRRWRPIAKLRLHHKPLVIVTRREDVLAVLRDSDTFQAPYKPKLPGPFVLGLQGDEYKRQRCCLTKVLDPGDLRDQIEANVHRSASIAVEAARERGHLDLGADLVHPLLNQVLEDFLGVRGPDPDTLWRWARDIFEDLFLNLTDESAIRQRAAVASKQMTAYVRQLVAQRMDVATAAGGEPPGDVLGRLVALLAANDPDALSQDDIVFSLIGLAIGWLWHGARAALITVDQLLEMPAALVEAQEAAAGGDDVWLARVIWETLRFRPVQPFIVRQATKGTMLAAGTDRETAVRTGSTVFVGTHSAMWDDAAIPCPASFDSTRADDQYLIFGRDMHRCLGEEINRIQLPAMLAPLLAVRGLQRGGELVWDGPRPDDLRILFP